MAAGTDCATSFQTATTTGSERSPPAHPLQFPTVLPPVTGVHNTPRASVTILAMPGCANTVKTRFAPGAARPMTQHSLMPHVQQVVLVHQIADLGVTQQGIQGLMARDHAASFGWRGRAFRCRNCPHPTHYPQRTERLHKIREAPAGGLVQVCGPPQASRWQISHVPWRGPLMASSVSSPSIVPGIITSSSTIWAGAAAQFQAASPLSASRT
jgi:hypothetical protein